MPKQKHNYEQIKQEFFDSKIDEVKVFIEQKYGKGKRSWSRAKQTTGWSKEKKARKESILQDALERSAKREAENLDIPVDQLKKAKLAVIWLFMNKLNKTIEKQKKSKDGEVNFSVKEFEQILKIIKTELWEPTNISKTDATIKGEPIDESLLIRD